MDDRPKTNNEHENVPVKSGLGFALFQCMKKYRYKILQYIADTDETDTYEQVLSRCIRTALRLKEKGLTRDDILSLCTHNHTNSVVPYIAAMFLGIKCANFDPALSPLDTIHLLKLIRPKIIFVDLESLPFMEECLKESKVDTELVVFGETNKYSNFSKYIEEHVEENNFQPVVIDNVKETAIIKFSSGTTGLPKGICLSHYGLLGSIQTSYTASFGGNVSLVYTTFYWISGTIFLIKCITVGASRVVCRKYDAATTWRLIEKYQITNLMLPPHQVQDFVAVHENNVNTRSLKYLVTTAAPLTVKLVEDLRKALPTTNILHGYGQTESSGFLSMFDPSDLQDLAMQIKKPISCGKVLPFYTWKGWANVPARLIYRRTKEDIRVRFSTTNSTNILQLGCTFQVVDPTTEKILGPNERGEFRYKGDYIFNGYYKMDSSAAFDGEGFVKSGDVVYYDEEGCLFIVDRIKEMFKYKGWHVLPSVLEEVLLNHPAIKEAAVIGVPHEIDGDHPMGIVSLKKGYEDVSPVSIQQYMDEIVSDSQRLRAGVKIVNKIPRTATGKIRRTELKKMVCNGEIGD